MNTRYIRWVYVALAGFLMLCMIQTLSYGQDPAATTPTPPKNSLIWLIQVSGIIGVFIFFLSLYFVTVIVQQILELRQVNMSPPELISTCERLINEGNIKDLFAIVESDNSFLGKTLHAGLLEVDNGIEEAREKLDRTAEAETVNMEKKITILATIGTLGPMIGLLGTLKGMITSFVAIAISGKNLEASKVAEGISEALVLTFEGVLLSIPAIFFYAMFRGRIAKFSIETTMLADDFLREIVRRLKRSRMKVPKA